MPLSRTLLAAAVAMGAPALLAATSAGMACDAAVADRDNSLLQARQSLEKKAAVQAEADGPSRAAPQAAGWLGWGRWVADGDYWQMQHLAGESLFARHVPGACFEEAPCRDSHSFQSHHFSSVDSWSSYYSSTFELGLSGGYQGFSGSIDSSLGTETGSSGELSKQLSYAVKTSQRKCYRLIRDRHCAYNRSNLQPELLERVKALPTGSPYTEEKMEAWQASFIQRFGTHVVMGSSHGALVHALISADSRSERSSACMDSSMCLKFGWIDPVATGANAELKGCSKTSTCDKTSGSSQSEKTKCTALGGDPALQSRICRGSVSQTTLDAWLAGGDLQAGSSAYKFSFMPISEFLTNVDFDEYYAAARALEKAVEYSNCRIGEDPPVQAWTGSGCKCVRECENGGVLDEGACACKCRGNKQHGWTGPNCQETYGSCQPGAGTGNPGSARACPVNNQCASWFSSNSCKATDVCCATNFGTKCCPFGSSCQCSSDVCKCTSGR